MSVADRISECIRKYNANDFDNALIQLCIAFDGTAKREFPKTKSVGDRFRAFIKANLDIITFFTFNTNMFIDCQFGQYTIEEFTYKVLRCGLLHEGEVSNMLRFASSGEPISIGDKEWCLPRTFIFGGILAVIGASSNSKQNVSEDIGVKIFGKSFTLNELFGRADLIRQSMQVAGTAT